jgi:hypothetical protein
MVYRRAKLKVLKKTAPARGAAEAKKAAEMKKAAETTKVAADPADVMVSRVKPRPRTRPLVRLLARQGQRLEARPR